jgi:hypothetical protein
VSFDAQEHQCVFALPNQDGDLIEIKRQTPVEITYTALTGLPEEIPLLHCPVQLTLPLAA